MSIWFGFGVPPPFSSAAPFEALMMFFLRFAPSPVGFGTPTTLFGRLVVHVKVDDKEPDDDDDDDTDVKVAAHPRFLFDVMKTTSSCSSSSSFCWEKKKVQSALI